MAVLGRRCRGLRGERRRMLSIGGSDSCVGGVKRVRWVDEKDEKDESGSELSEVGDVPQGVVSQAPSTEKVPIAVLE